MKQTIQIFFFMLSFGIVSLGSANAQRTYTLDECLEQALSNNVRMKKDVEAAVEAGITTRNDLLQIRLRQNETQSSRIQVENALSLSRNLLAQYMGLGSDSVDGWITNCPKTRQICLKFPRMPWPVPANIICCNRT